MLLEILHHVQTLLSLISFFQPVMSYLRSALIWLSSIIRHPSSGGKVDNRKCHTRSFILWNTKGSFKLFSFVYPSQENNKIMMDAEVFLIYWRTWWLWIWRCRQRFRITNLIITSYDYFLFITRLRFPISPSHSVVYSLFSCFSI